jgi:hypothetical protein
MRTAAFRDEPYRFQLSACAGIMQCLPNACSERKRREPYPGFWVLNCFACLVQLLFCADICVQLHVFAKQIFKYGSVD